MNVTAPQSTCAPTSNMSPVAWLCLMSVLLFSLGSSILTPYFSMYVADQMGLGIGFAGLLVTCKVVCQRAFALPGGICTDWVGSRNTALAGIAIRAVSFALLLQAPTRALLITAACLNGIGAAMFQPAIRKILLTPFRDSEAILARLAGLRSASLNLGAAIGPLLGLVLVSAHFEVACELIVVIYLANLLMLLTLRVAQDTHPIQSAIPGLAMLLRPEMRPVLVLQIAFFAGYSHFEYLMPISFGKSFGSGCVALAFAVNTGIVILAQAFLATRLRGMSARLGIGCFGAFCALMAFVPHIASTAAAPVLGPAVVAVSMILFTLGEIILSINIDIETAKRSGESNAGTAFGFVSLVGSLSLAAANTINTALFDHFGTAAGWTVNAVVLAAASAFIFNQPKGKVE